MVMSMNGAISTNTHVNGNHHNNGFSNGSSFGGATTNDGIDLDGVRETVLNDDEGKWDITAFRDKLTLLNGKLLAPESANSNEVEELTPTPWATAQMCGRLGIPTAYFRRCPIDLQDAQFNVWARHHDNFETAGFTSETNGSNQNGHTGRNGTNHSGNERWLLRVKHDSLRGVLSDRYSRLDNGPFLNILQPLVPDRLQVKWFALTGESLHLRLIDPTLAREVLPDDRLNVGLHIGNSEVGRRSVTIDAIVWRLVCSNGLVRLVKGKSLLQQRHIFISQSNFKRNLEHAMGEALTTAAGLLEKMAQATTEHLDDIETVIEKIVERHGLSEAFQEKIKNALRLENQGQQETLYGLTNALTQAAQTLPPDDRYGLEVMAGEVMERGAPWLNSLPKAKVKVRSKADSAATSANGSPFVTDAPFATAHRHGKEVATTEVLPPRLPSNGLATRVQPTESQPTAPTLPESHDVERCDVETVPIVTAPAATMTLSGKEKMVRDEPKANSKLASFAQKDVICALAVRRSLGTYDLHYLMEQEFDKSSLDELTQPEATQFTLLLQQRRREELLAPIPDYDENDELIEEDE